MGIIINRLYELADDLQTLFVGERTAKPEYYEVYARKVVYNGISYQAFTLRAKTYYEVVLSHIPKGADFVLSPKLSAVGLMCYYNKETKQLFLYNCTQNQIYIQEGANIGSVLYG